MKIELISERDVNAAKNILTEGINLLSSGTGEYTDGDDVRLSNKQSSVKSEAPESLAQGWFTMTIQR